MAHSRTPFPALSSQRSASPDGEASGLIDIRTMGAVLTATELRAEAPRTRAEVPSFSGLTVSPSLLAQPESVRPPTGRQAAVPRSQAPLLTLLGVLTAGVLGLTGYVVTRPAPEAAPVITIIKQNPLADASVKRNEAEPEPAAEVAAEPEPAAEPEKSLTKEKGKQPPRKQPKIGEASKESDKEKPAVVEAPKPEAKKDYGVDCILGKASCGDKSAEKPASPVDKPVTPSSDLPEKLEQADISAGTSAARSAAASSCARFAKGGEKVQIKLSIAGPSGSVIGASPVEDAGNPQLASCVAGELKQASFRKVQKQQIGTVVTVKF